ncbi:MAG: polysaccharide biosynthesis C-terminal domain-containing protein [Simkaniaceae bacterium]|nr:MAG: polysaccharide biosynthesis C-terminal domain-containing protein [Simkaniaceae bacterium]
MMSSRTFTQHPIASLRHLLSLTLPLTLSLFSSYLLNITDRFLLSRYGLSAFEACAAAGGLYFFFQMLSLRFVSTVQAFVGEAYGSKTYEKASSYTWQMIWFSLISPLLTVPLGLLIGTYFFKGSPIEQEALTYFKWMIFGIFLFSLEGTLCGFFSGIGDSKKIFKVHLLSHLFNIGLSIVLIFGIPSFIPPLGILGAALGTLIAKTISCLILFYDFYFNSKLKIFETKRALLIPKRFFRSIKLAFPRAIGQGMAILCWNFAAQILIRAGGTDLLSCSLGSTLHFALINDAIGIAVITISSYLIGSKQFNLFSKLFRSVAICLLFNAIILSIPLILFSSTLIKVFCLKELNLQELRILMNTCYWVWAGLVCSSIYYISFALISSLKDTWFYMIIQMLVSPLIYFIVFYLHNKSSWTPEYFWIAVAFHPLLPALIFFPRSFHKINKLRSLFLNPSNLNQTISQNIDQGYQA